MSSSRYLVALATAVVATAAVASSPAAAQRPVLSPATRQYVRVDTAVLALVNARVIDGTGAPAREGETIVVRDGRIVALGAPATVAVPAGALVMDLA